MKKNFLKILKTFAVFVKDPVRIKKKKNNKLQTGREIFATYISEKQLLSKIYREHSKLNHKKTNIPIRKLAQDMNKHLPRKINGRKAHEKVLNIITLWKNAY